MDLTHLNDLDAGRKAALAVPAAPLPDDWPADPEQSFELPRYWRDAAEVPEDLRDRGAVSRDDLWAMADQAARGDRSWAEVMIASFA